MNSLINIDHKSIKIKSDYKPIIEFIEHFNKYRKGEKGDDFYTFNNVEWEEYENLLEEIEDVSYCRISYLDGLLEIMSPGRKHETVKELTSILIIAYCDEKEIDYFPIGSTTLKNKEAKTGKEPDVSYAINSNKDFPDLAVEVNYSSGSINDLERYKRLGIKEVWLWDKEDELIFYILENGDYVKSDQSKILKPLKSSIIQEYIKIMRDKNPRIVKQEFIKKINSL